MNRRNEVANAIFEGITAINVKTETNFQSKNFELLSLISFLGKLKIKEITKEKIKNLLSDEEVERFSKIQNLKEKVYLYMVTKSNQT